jgi:peroxiredoxin
VNSLFQQTLKQLTFKTFHHNQIATFDYDDLFANLRVIVFSLTNFRTMCSGLQLDSFTSNYAQFKELGIDKIYVVDSTDWLIGPHIEKRAPTLIGLPDRDMAFVQALAEHYKYKKETFDLARYWQYVIIINNGEPERIWHNPFKESAPLEILKSQSHRYRKVSGNAVLTDLIDKAN